MKFLVMQIPPFLAYLLSVRSKCTSGTYFISAFPLLQEKKFHSHINEKHICASWSVVRSSIEGCEVKKVSEIDNRMHFLSFFS
jgi:hypothetical protein